MAIIKCPGCGRMVDSDLNECSFCGGSLSGLADFSELINKSMSGDEKSQYDLAMHYLYNYEGTIDDEQGLYWLKTSAGQGYAPAQCQLAYIYQDGDDTASDIEKAVNMFTQAAVQGYAPAQAALADCYSSCEGVIDTEKAFFWYEKAAEQGHYGAQYSLGMCYLNGVGTEKNIEKAIFWLTQAAEQGFDMPYYRLGYIYSSGVHMPCDEDRAEHWYGKIIEKGLRIDIFCGNVCRINRDDNAINLEKALYYYTECAKKGDNKAQYSLSQHYLTTEKDNEKYMYWLREAAERGNAEAQCSMGGIYYFGQEGIKKDFRAAYEWYMLAAEQGNGLAEYNIGTFYLSGKMVAKDYERALYWFEKSAAQGYAKAIFNIGYCYENGYGVAANRDKAIECFNKAANSGMKIAEKYAVRTASEANKAYKADKYKSRQKIHKKADAIANVVGPMGTILFVLGLWLMNFDESDNFILANNIHTIALLSLSVILMLATVTVIIYELIKLPVNYYEDNKQLYRNYLRVFDMPDEEKARYQELLDELATLESTTATTPFATAKEAKIYTPIKPKLPESPSR